METMRRNVRTKTGASGFSGLVASPAKLYDLPATFKQQPYERNINL
jgi:hypothetical protein